MPKARSTRRASASVAATNGPSPPQEPSSSTRRPPGVATERQALWQYLRVDALYGEDVEEQAKALYHLVGLFDKVKKDPIRGKECAARLLDKRFAGTAYQRLLMQETKPEP